MVRQRQGYGGAEVKLSVGQRLTGWATGPGPDSECLASTTAARPLQNAETAVLGQDFRPTHLSTLEI